MTGHAQQLADDVENALDVEITHEMTSATVASMKPETPPHSPAHASFLSARKIINEKLATSQSLKAQHEARIAAAAKLRQEAIAAAEDEYAKEMNAAQADLMYITAVQEAMAEAASRLNKTAG